ncbi:hypothetical protein [Sorangium sp. So ce1000]|uniref:hypothetical protein n=1 Tax=Sorangium sp. So ce1000 TaxID=3133325 RepID=UPI003F627B76
MSPISVYHCQRCGAPLEAPPGSRAIVCRYCGTSNELQRPGPSGAAPRPATASSRTLATSVIAIAIAVAVAAGVAMFVPRGVRVPGALRGPLELEWSNEHKFVVKSDEALYGDVAIFEGSYQITFHGFPEGTKWKVAEKSGRIESDIYDIIKPGGPGSSFRRRFFHRMKSARCSGFRWAAIASESKTATRRRGISKHG